MREEAAGRSVPATPLPLWPAPTSRGAELPCRSLAADGLQQGRVIGDPGAIASRRKVKPFPYLLTGPLKRPMQRKPLRPRLRVSKPDSRDT